MGCEVTEAEEVPERLAAADALPLPGRDGVPTETLLGILLHPVHRTAINTSIPAGRKENVYCVVDNKRNSEKKVKAGPTSSTTTMASGKARRLANFRIL